MSGESLRESFEKWAVKHLGDERFLIRDERQPDKYDAYLVDHMWAGYAAGAAAMNERAAQIDIKEIIADHETSYIQRLDRQWDWICSCGARQWFHTREFAVDMTRAHWTDEIRKAIRSLEVTK